jgi:hypothetical protein
MQGLDMLSDYDYIAIFDADFKPEPDFLVRPHFLSWGNLPCLCFFLIHRYPCRANLSAFAFHHFTLAPGGGLLTQRSTLAHGAGHDGNSAEHASSA